MVQIFLLPFKVILVLLLLLLHLSQNHHQSIILLLFFFKILLQVFKVSLLQLQLKSIFLHSLYKLIQVISFLHLYKETFCCRLNILYLSLLLIGYLWGMVLIYSYTNYSFRFHKIS